MTAAGGGFSVTLESAIARYGNRHGVGPVSARLEGPGLYWIVGPNGSGKSTLLRMVAGLRRPSAGSVSWSAGGNDLPRETLRAARALSSPDVQLYEDLSSRENLEFVAKLRGARDPAGAAGRALADAGIADRADERPRALSSGLRQRLRLAATWVAEPSILLLDEPSSNLDEAGRTWLWQRVRARSASALCVVATNQLQEVGSEEPRLSLGRGTGT